MTGAARETGGTEVPPDGPDEGRRAVVLTSAAVGVIGAGLALTAIAPASTLRWCGVAVAAFGLTGLAVPRSRPSGTGDEEPLALPDGPGAAFVWSRFAPAMTVTTFASAGIGALLLALVAARTGFVGTGVLVTMIGTFALAVALRFLPVLRTRQVLVTPDALVVAMRGQRAALPWSSITAVDVARPAPEQATMGGAIVLRTAGRVVPAPPRLWRRLRTLAAPYAGADVALPVAGLRHDPGALLTAIERGVPRTTEPGPASGPAE